MTEEEKEGGRTVTIETSEALPDSVNVTITPTDTWYAFNDDDEEYGEQGQPVSYEVGKGFGGDYLITSSVYEDPERGVSGRHVLLDLKINQV